MTILQRDARFMMRMGVLLLIISIIGFSPRYIIPITTGAYSLPSLWMHPHVAVSTLWLLLFIFQPWLITKNNITLHKTVGIFSVLIALATMVTGIALQIDLLPVLDGQQMLNDAGFRLFGAMPIFVVFFGAAIVARRKAAFHMRYMYLGTLGLIEAPLHRLFNYVVGFSFQTSGLLIVTGHLALIFALLTYDKRCQGKVHAATWWGLGGFFVIQFVASLIVFSDWWQKLPH